MDIVELYAEYLASLILLLFSFNMIFIGIIEPAMESIQINYEARADKAATFTNTLNEAQGVHDQHVGRTPGIDPVAGFNEKDSGLSRTYFRPEQFILLPAVDTDISSNPNVPIETRTIAISTDYKKVGTAQNSNESRGLKINADPMLHTLSYKINRDSLYDKQVTYDSISKDFGINQLKNLAIYPKASYGTQIQQPNGLMGAFEYGGFNITLDSAIHPSSGKESNSIIFVAGRVPSK